MEDIVEAGELTIKGELDDTDMATAFVNLENDFKNLENQVNQTNAGMRHTTDISSGLVKTMSALGIAGVTAMTALAIKSPVLSGAMAKMQVETMKLSNTLGRELSPVFSAISDNLIPSINKAFSDNSEFMGDMADNAASLVDSISSLIKLDWGGLSENLDKMFLSKPTPSTKEGEKEDVFAETKQTWSDLKSFYAPENAQYIGEHVTGAAIAEVGTVLNLIFHGIIDTVQWIGSTNSEKDKAFATADGVSR